LVYDQTLLDGALAVGQQYLDAVHSTPLADEAPSGRSGCTTTS
jgi:hypothetical protein